MRAKPFRRPRGLTRTRGECGLREPPGCLCPPERGQGGLGVAVQGQKGYWWEDNATLGLSALRCRLSLCLSLPVFSPPALSTLFPSPPSSLPPSLSPPPPCPPHSEPLLRFPEASAPQNLCVPLNPLTSHLSNTSSKPWLGYG